MAKQPHYGTTTKVFHWLIVALLIVQYPLGKFMPGIHRGMTPGDAMTLHISFGITILAVMVSRLCLPHHPFRRAGKMASCLAAIDVGSSALAALCAGACDHDDRLDLWIRAWLVDFAVLRGPSPNVADRRLAARK
jgi:Prokaryotic cytochrome b561